MAAPTTTAAALLRARAGLPFGYHNSFHLHATEAFPPPYSIARARPSTAPAGRPEPVPLPTYDCSIERHTVVDLRCEFVDPFMECYDLRWRPVSASLQGTKLSFHYLKSAMNLDDTRGLRPRRNTYSFSLQHAEVGLALDSNNEGPIPKLAVMNLLPSAARGKLFESKPNLFEGRREWVLRLRLEGRQFLMCFKNQEVMLDWVECLCAAIDISPPLDDRSDPRYRSLPRRSRRQRQLESMFRDNVDELIPPQAPQNRLVAQQQRIFQSLYPNFAVALDNGPESGLRPVVSELETITRNDPDMDDLDPADAREMDFENPRLQSPNNSLGRRTSRNSQILHQDSSEPYDPKRSSRCFSPCAAALVRYRRRCAPIMSKYSPRSSDIIFHKGRRVKIDYKKDRLVPFEVFPPRYPRKRDTDRSSRADRLREPPAPPSTAVDAAVRRQSSMLESYATADDDDAFRTMSRSSAPQTDNDGGSIRSIAGLTIGSAADGAEQQAGGAASQAARRGGADEITGAAAQAAPAGAAASLPFKEKAGQMMRRLQPGSREEDVLHAFAGPGVVGQRTTGGALARRAVGPEAGIFLKDYSQPSLAFSLHSHTLGSRRFPAAAGLEEEASPPFFMSYLPKIPFRAFNA